MTLALDPDRLLQDAADAVRAGCLDNATVAAVAAFDLYEERGDGLGRDVARRLVRQIADLRTTTLVAASGLRFEPSRQLALPMSGRRRGA